MPTVLITVEHRSTGPAFSLQYGAAGWSVTKPVRRRTAVGSLRTEMPSTFPWRCGSTNPIARASSVMAECSVIAEGHAVRSAAE